MNTMEILTLLLVIFAALAYIDNHNDKKKYTSSTAQSLGCLFLNIHFQLNRGQIGVTSDYLSK